MKNNTLSKIAVALVIFFLASPLIIPQTGSIPWIPLAKDAPENIPGRNGSAPLFDEIGIPIYPGAYLTSVYQAVNSNEIESMEVPLPGIFLVTIDDQEKVKEFYKINLKKSDGWIYYEDYSVFVRGDLSQALSRTVPGVAIREETGESYDLQGADPKIVSSLKTRIKILYKP